MLTFANLRIDFVSSSSVFQPWLAKAIFRFGQHWTNLWSGARLKMNLMKLEGNTFHKMYNSNHIKTSVLPLVCSQVWSHSDPQEYSGNVEDKFQFVSDQDPLRPAHSAVNHTNQPEQKWGNSILLGHTFGGSFYLLEMINPNSVFIS